MGEFRVDFTAEEAASIRWRKAKAGLFRERQKTGKAIGVDMDIKVKDIYFNYDKEILRDISFSLTGGAFAALLGINGSGKSTLLKNMARILAPHKGCILLDGKDIQSFRRSRLAQKMAYVAQNERASRIKVYDAVLIGRKPYMKYFPSERDHQIVREIMAYLELEKFSMKYMDELSGGEVQKIRIARALAQEPEVLLLDEPTSALDLKNQLDVMDIVKQYCREKGIMTVVSIHDVNLSLRYATDFILLKNQEIYRYGSKEILTSENLSEVYSVKIKVYHLDGNMLVVPLKQSAGEETENDHDKQ